MWWRITKRATENLLKAILSNIILIIPATVKYRGKTYKVTSIGSKEKITVPKSRYKAYKKLFKKAGFGSKTVWKKG